MQINNAGVLAVAFVFSAIIGYLLGSINFAIIFSKALYKQDVRTMGSGNAGMTNVLRSFGKKGAIPTLAGDVFKGIAAVLLGRLVFFLLVPQMDTLYGAYIAGIFTIVGHMFPLYFHFKGGKGVATSGGVILALQPLLALILVTVFLLVVLVSKMVSLGSVIGISLYPVVTLVWALLNGTVPVVFCTVCSAVIAALVVWMHRGNIKRIASGTEYKFGQKKGDDSTPPPPATQ